MMKRYFLAAVSLVALSASQSAANLVANGDFELPTPHPSTYATYDSVSNPNGLTGWTVTAGSVDHVNLQGLWGNGVDPAPSPIMVIDLNGNTKGTIEQTLSGLTVGGMYNFSFSVNGNFDGLPTTKETEYTFGNVTSTITFTGVIGPGNGPGSGDWVTYNGTFTASSPSEIIRFKSLAPTPDNPFPVGAFGMLLDNVVVTAVPEASSFLFGGLALCGLGAVVAYRGRSGKVAA